MATILTVVAVVVTGAIFPHVLKRWHEARTQMERLQMQRQGDHRAGRMHLR